MSDIFNMCGFYDSVYDEKYRNSLNYIYKDFNLYSDYIYMNVCDEKSNFGGCYEKGVIKENIYYKKSISEKYRTFIHEYTHYIIDKTNDIHTGNHSLAFMILNNIIYIRSLVLNNKYEINKAALDISYSYFNITNYDFQDHFRFNSKYIDFNFVNEKIKEMALRYDNLKDLIEAVSILEFYIVDKSKKLELLEYQYFDTFLNSKNINLENNPFFET